MEAVVKPKWASTPENMCLSRAPTTYLGQFRMEKETTPMTYICFIYNTAALAREAQLGSDAATVGVAIQPLFLQKRCSSSRDDILKNKS